MDQVRSIEISVPKYLLNLKYDLVCPKNYSNFDVNALDGKNLDPSTTFLATIA